MGTGWIDERVIMWKGSKTNEHKIPSPQNCHLSSTVLLYLRCFGPFKFRLSAWYPPVQGEFTSCHTTIFTGKFSHFCTNINLKFYSVSWHIHSSHATACSKMGMFCLDCDKLIKLQTKQMIELEIKRDLASETKQYIKRKSIKNLCMWYCSRSSLRTS
jgi:hypothetical protein